MHIFRALLLSLLIILAVSTCTVYCQEDSSINNKTKTTLLYRLVEMGQIYDCYFTVEEAWTDYQAEAVNAHETELRNNLVQRSIEKRELKQDLEDLHQSVPNFIYEFDKQNPKIIHIIDARLAHQNGYGLDRIMSSFYYNGPVGSLTTAIGKQGMPVSNPLALDTHEAAFVDFFTPVEVTGENLRVRDALSNFIPLEGRGRIIWMARTKLGPNEVSYVHFQDPPKRNKQSNKK